MTRDYLVQKEDETEDGMVVEREWICCCRCAAIGRAVAEDCSGPADSEDGTIIEDPFVLVPPFLVHYYSVVVLDSWVSLPVQLPHHHHRHRLRRAFPSVHSWNSVDVRREL